MTTATVRKGTQIMVGLGQLRVTGDPDTVLVSLGLGSCVSMCVYDPVSKVGGIAHMVLPQYREGRSNKPSPKFVDCAIPMLLEKMKELGALQSRLIVKIVGGAQMMQPHVENALFKIGERNVATAKEVLEGLCLPLRAADTGGTHGRTVRLYLDSGKLLVTIVGGETNEL